MTLDFQIQVSKVKECQQSIHIKPQILLTLSTLLKVQRSQQLVQR